MATQEKPAEKPADGKLEIVECKRGYFQKSRNFGWVLYRNNGTLIKHGFTKEEVDKILADEKAAGGGK